MRIITLTLSPAFDIHCRGQIRLAHENLIQRFLCQAGGKGVNISRALSENGYQNLALLLLGAENQAEFLHALDTDGLTYQTISVPGRIRENITIHGEDGVETRISFPGFAAESKILEKVEQALSGLIDSSTILTMTGRLPEGVDIGRAKQMLRNFQAQGAKIVIDSRSFSLNDLLELKPWLIKPNQEEISQYLGREVRSLQEIIREACALHASGIAHVMVSMGGDGALLACEEGVFLAVPPEIPVISTIGAGDSSIAGFLAAAEEGADDESRLAQAVAWGSAACMTQGTLPPKKETISQLTCKVQRLA